MKIIRGLLAWSGRATGYCRTPSRLHPVTARNTEMPLTSSARFTFIVSVKAARGRRNARERTHERPPPGRSAPAAPSVVRRPVCSPLVPSDPACPGPSPPGPPPIPSPTVPSRRSSMSTQDPCQHSRHRPQPGLHPADPPDGVRGLRGPGRDRRARSPAIAHWGADLGDARPRGSGGRVRGGRRAGPPQRGRRPAAQSGSSLSSPTAGSAGRA